MINLTDEIYNKFCEIGYKIKGEFDLESPELINKTEFTKVDDEIKELQESLQKEFTDDTDGYIRNYCEDMLKFINKYQGQDYILVPYYSWKCYSIVIWVVVSKDYEYIDEIVL